jgi:hypothetical protein
VPRPGLDDRRPRPARGRADRQSVASSAAVAGAHERASSEPPLQPTDGEAYLGWVRRFLGFHGRRDAFQLGALEVGQFLSRLATADRVSASTQNQALSALLFLGQDPMRCPFCEEGTLRIASLIPASIPSLCVRGP